jgi:hypothetical protein
MQLFVNYLVLYSDEIEMQPYRQNVVLLNRGINKVEGVCIDER